MIKSGHGTVEIDGMQGEILFDFAHIYDEIIEVAPEIVAATVLHFGDKLNQSNMDMRGVKCAEMLLSHLIDGEDNNNE